MLSSQGSVRHWQRQVRGLSSCVCTCAMCCLVKLTRAEMARTSLQQSSTLKADTLRASVKMDSCNIRAALQILQTSARAPQNTQTAAEVHSLVAIDTDEHEIARINNAMCSDQAGLLQNSRSHQRSW